MAKSTGGGGSFVYNGVSLPFSTIEPSVTREMDDASDSTNYDIASGIVHKSQLPVCTQTSFAIEGKVDLAIHPLSMLAPLFSGAVAVPASVRWNATSTFGHGLFDITDFKGTIDPMKTLTFSATMITNGIFTPNA